MNETLALSPGRLLLGVAFVCLALCGAVLLLATQTPWLGLTLVPDADEGVSVLSASGPSHAVPTGARLLSIRGQDADAEPFALSALDLLEEPDFLDTYAEQTAFYERQARIAEVFRGSPLTLQFKHNGLLRELTVSPSTRPLGDLPTLFWFQLFVGASGFLIASWAFVASRRSYASRCFLALGVTFLIFTAPAAYYGTRELFVDPELFRALAAINHFGAFTFGAALVLLFLSHPRRLLGPFWTFVVPCALVLWCLCDFFQAFEPDLGYRLPILLETVSAMLLAGVQWWATRGDPLARAELRWLGLSVIVGTGLFVFSTAGVSMLGLTPPFPQGYAFGFFSLMYVGFALGLRRHQLLGLDEWAYRILLWVLGAMALVIVDLVLVLYLGAHSALSLSASLLICGFAYLPLRNWLWARAVSVQPSDSPDLFQSVIDAVFASTPDEQERLWVHLLEGIFQPAEIERTLEASPEQVTITEAGLGLWIPKLDGSRALRLKFPWRGRDLFQLRHLHLAQTLVSLMRHAESARQGFARGVRTERERIARDLHDNLGARLLTGLYAENVQDSREGIRHAISDMRSIVQELMSDTSVPLLQIVADLRHETAERARSAGLVLEWPHQEFAEQLTLSPTLARHYTAIVRELVSNTIRHADARTFRVQIRCENAMLLTCFEDDGTGLREHEHDNALHSIRSRLRELGGTLAIQPVEQGTSVHVRLGLQEAVTTFDSFPSERVSE